MFKGFNENIIDFFLDIRMNNTMEYFHNNKKRYEEVKKQFVSLIEELSNTAVNIDGSIDIRPNKCLARIRRDTRFSNDKTPYRDHLWFIFKRNSEGRYGLPFLWFELSPENAVCGVGIWGDEKEIFKLFRQNLIEKPNEFITLINDLKKKEEDVIIYGKSYKRLKSPENLDESLKKYYMHKEIYIKKHIEYKKVFSKDIAIELEKHFKNFADIFKYFNRLYDEVLKNAKQ